MKRRLFAILILAAMGLVLTVNLLQAAEPVVENVDFIDAEIRDVFRSLGVAGQLNVLLTAEVKGTVTIALRQRMSVKDAISLVARTYEYDLRWLSQMTVVVGKSSTLRTNFDTNIQATRVFDLSYAEVDEIAEALKVVLDPVKQLSKGARTNQIVVYGSPLQIENAADIIERMDHPMPQVNIECRMEEIEQGSLEELGLDWGTDFKFGIGPGFSIVSYPSITATLKALETKNKAKLLAQPNASSLDSQTAQILMGTRYPISTTDLKTGAVTITYIDVGTKLTVKSRVNMENIVTVQVTAEVSSVTEIDEVSGLPVIRTRTTQSTARLRNDQTFVLTGLMQEEDTDKDTGVPLLSKLPLIGELFKTKRDETKATVISVFLTPHIQAVAQDEMPPAQNKTSTQAAAGSAPPAVAPAAPVIEPAASPTGGTGASSTSNETITGAPVEQTPPAPEGSGPSLEEIAAQTPAAPAAPVVEPAGGAGTETEPASPTVEPAAMEQPAEVTTTAVPESNLPGPDEIRDLPYTVQKGDTFTAIGRLFGVSAEQIIAYNRLTKDTVLKPGQLLKIPIPDNHKYIVQPKETLWRIAKRYGLTVELLAKINGLADPTKISVGQVIVLPCAIDQIVNSEY